MYRATTEEKSNIPLLDSIKEIITLFHRIDRIMLLDDVPSALIGKKPLTPRLYYDRTGPNRTRIARAQVCNLLVCNISSEVKQRLNKLCSTILLLQ